MTRQISATAEDKNLKSESDSGPKKSAES